MDLLGAATVRKFSMLWLPKDATGDFLSLPLSTGKLTAMHTMQLCSLLLDRVPGLSESVPRKLAVVGSFSLDNLQSKDWPERHKLECRIIARAVIDADGLMRMPLAFEYLLVMLKIIIKLKRDEITDEVPSGKQATNRTFNDLMSHEGELIRSPAVMQLYSQLKPYIACLDKAGKICPHYSAFVRLYGRFHTNAFSIADYFAGDVGRGLYLGPSMLDHSCDNNAVQTFDGKTLIIKAIAGIASLSDVRIAYENSFNIRQVRQALLQQQYFFTCSCRLCTEVQLEEQRGAVKCPNTECVEPVPLLMERKTDNDDRPLCSVCNCDVTERLRVGRALVARMEKDQVDAKLLDGEVDSSARKKMLMDLVREGDAVLHPSNFVLGIACLDLYNLMEADGCGEDGVKFLEKALPVIEKHANKYESSAMGTLSELTHAALDRRNFAMARKYGKELLDRLRIVPGEDSPVYAEYRRILDDSNGSCKSDSKDSTLDTHLLHDK